MAEFLQGWDLLGSEIDGAGVYLHSDGTFPSGLVTGALCYAAWVSGKVGNRIKFYHDEDLTSVVNFTEAGVGNRTATRQAPTSGNASGGSSAFA